MKRSAPRIWKGGTETMEAYLGSSLPVFLGLTILVMGGCALLTGQSLAQGWKPLGMVYAYALLIGLGDRFLVFALFDGVLLSPKGFIVHTAIIAVMADAAYRVTRARLMVSQYPWLYERSGPFGWRELPGARMTG
jgi:hypothetical protein